MTDIIKTVQAKFNNEYRSYQRRWSTWPTDHATRCKAVEERINLDRLELQHCDAVLGVTVDRGELSALRSYRRLVQARISTAEQFLAQ